MAKDGELGDDDRDDHVHLVTSASKPHSQEISERARRYLISMGIRTVCVVLAIFVLQGWLRLVAILGALVLPWIAVVVANAGPVEDDERPEFAEIGQKQIEGGPRGVIDSRPTDGDTGGSSTSEDAGGHDGSASETMSAEPPRQRRPRAS